MKLLRVLVFGGRDYSHQALVWGALDRAYVVAREMGYHGLMAIEGGARGADKAAGTWAYHRSQAHVRIPAPWDEFGKPAGMMRNEYMARTTRPRLGIAFPGGRGTAHMQDTLNQLGVPVVDGEDADAVEFAIRQAGRA